jgi:L-ascorbate metabolism protein UlaG (beta-lactamase superfamily)
VKIILALILSLALEAGAAAAGLDDYKNLALPAAPARSVGDHALRVTFMGVATLLFDDGDTAIMTDGFFSRPPAAVVTRGTISPDKERVTAALQRAGVKSLAAVIAVHSHFDHAMDSPMVASLTGAMLVGSESTANIGRGAGLAEDRIKVVANGDTVKFGRFNVTFVHSAHLPIGYAPGAITAPLRPPVKASDYQQGVAYTLLIEHDGKTILVQGSAGFVPGELAGRKADVAYLGMGGLGSRDDAYREGYWRELVSVPGVRRVIPIHWDNFYKSAEEPLTPAEGFDNSMAYVVGRAARDKVDVRLPVSWVAVDPFSGL